MNAVVIFPHHLCYVGCHHPSSDGKHLCQFMMVFGLTLAMIMGDLDLNKTKVGLVFVKLENCSEMHPMKCSREFNKIYIYIYYLYE